jgi:hypothetical protein
MSCIQMTEYYRTSIGPAAPNNPELHVFAQGFKVLWSSVCLQGHRDLTFPSAMDNGVAKSGEYSDHY